MLTADDLFGRHLDLGPLGPRRQGVVRCIFHDDRHPSLSVDLDRGVFHCFACRAAGGLRDFALRVGESGPVPGPSAESIGLRQRMYDARLAQAMRLGTVIYHFEGVVLALRDEGSREQDWAKLGEAAEIETRVRALIVELEALGPIK